MSLTGLDVFDRTVHTTNRWLDERRLEGFLAGVALELSADAVQRVLPKAIRHLWPATPKAA